MVLFFLLGNGQDTSPSLGEEAKEKGGKSAATNFFLRLFITASYHEVCVVFPADETLQKGEKYSSSALNKYTAVKKNNCLKLNCVKFVFLLFIFTVHCFPQQQQQQAIFLPPVRLKMWQRIIGKSRITALH